MKGHLQCKKKKKSCSSSIKEETLWICDPGVISQRSTVQQPHVEDRRPSRLHGQESVISQRSTVQQPHVNDRRPSRLHAQESVISQRTTVQEPHVEDRRPSRHHAKETAISQRSTVQQPHALGVTIGRVEDTEHAPPSHDRVGECPLQATNDVYEDNSQENLEENSNHHVAPTTSISKVRRTRGPISKIECNPPKGQKWRCIFIDQQPVGVEASKLADVLGLYARNDNYFPPYKEWKEQSKQSLNDVMKDILVQYDFVDKERFPTNMADVTRFCEFSISSKLKEWRATLKRAGYMEGVDGELSVMPPNERIKGKGDGDEMVLGAGCLKVGGAGGAVEEEDGEGGSGVARDEDSWASEATADSTTLRSTPLETNGPSGPTTTSDGPSFSTPQDSTAVDKVPSSFDTEVWLIEMD
ncbi:hypothetical protein Taro_042382 [Colocasia esculenta]|uniref:Uncharacterized protein n=1 Tax=Colocasia esculenta TaxID=4460 RepID=A0A843WSN8_COLES|nr:hypothetical protein [Colocasia esculenta]